MGNNYKSCQVAMYKAFNGLYKKYNRQFPGKSITEKKSMTMNTIFNQMSTVQEEKQYKFARDIELEIFQMDMKGLVPHIYLEDSGLVGFLTNTLKPGKQEIVTEIVESEIRDYYKNNIGKMDKNEIFVSIVNTTLNLKKSEHEQLTALAAMELLDGNENPIVYPFHIHSSISGITGGFVIDSKGSIWLEAIQDDGSSDVITINRLDAIYNEIKTKSQKHKESIALSRFILNTFFYTKMGSEILKNEAPKGAPKQNVHPNAPKMSIGVLPKLNLTTGTRNYNPSGESAAYFRPVVTAFLKDERYTNKRWTTIYKRATICHRKGADVGTVETLQDLKESIKTTTK